jgi:hypothetical protein
MLRMFYRNRVPGNARRRVFLSVGSIRGSVGVCGYTVLSKSVLAANHENCSRPTAFPRPPGLETGLWIRQVNCAALLEVLFTIEVNPEGIAVRRVLLTPLDRLPDWSLRPDAWGAYPPWPVVDV